MKVQDLFSKLTFDEVAEALQRTHQSDKSVKALCGYKEAFDTLCNLEFKGEGGQVTFDVHENSDYEKELPLLTNGVEGDLWESIVGNEIIFPENTSLLKQRLPQPSYGVQPFMDFHLIIGGNHVRSDIQNLVRKHGNWKRNYFFPICGIKKRSEI